MLRRHAAPTRLLRAMRRHASSGVPLIDLSEPTERVTEQVASACAEWGFFEVVNHGVPPSLVKRFEDQTSAFFDLPMEEKRALRRSSSNARGFFDDELTKQKRDWKEALDFGVPGTRDWDVADDDASNANLDGFNRFPSAASLPSFRPTMVEYFDALTGLSERIAALMSLGLGMPEDHFDQLLHRSHTSYLRLNYYPTCVDIGAPPPAGTAPLGISPHRDAGFLTVLYQDPNCHSLQVARGATEVPTTDGAWSTVSPTPGAFTINTGDMARIWSNDRYHAPLHRVLTHPTEVRYSAPFFFNPGYGTRVLPLPSLGRPNFEPCLWGYYRAQRFAGDFADFGAEIQTSDYMLGSGSPHLARQAEFEAGADFKVPFSIDGYRHLLEMPGQ